ncbi:MAG: hypothetical protein JOZ69_14895 [Myxococcales bacterium]|nr:hypothetical protein [Myxococcales bacterium]
MTQGDTGALLSYLDAKSPDHTRYRTAIDAARARYVPGLVLAELDYFLEDDRPAMRSFVSDIERRAFLYAPPTDAQLTRAMNIDQRYPRLGHQRGAGDGLYHDYQLLHATLIVVGPRRGWLLG